MSSVQYRSESPYVPRPIDRSEERSHASAAFDHGALRVLIVAAQPHTGRSESALIGLANALCDSGHVVDFIADLRPPLLDGRVRLIKLQDAVHAKRPTGFGDLLNALSMRMKAEKRLSACLTHIVSERVSDYDLVIDDQTLLDEIFAFKARGVRVFSLITQPRGIERSARKTVRSLDGVLAPSPSIAEEIVHELGAPRVSIEILEGTRLASTVSRLYSKTARRG